jgi:hypothetical protein
MSDHVPRAETPPDAGSKTSPSAAATADEKLELKPSVLLVREPGVGKSSLANLSSVTCRIRFVMCSRI